MATVMHTPVRPTNVEDHRGPSRPRSLGFKLAGLGLILALVAFGGSLAAAADPSIRATTLPWAFGLTTLAFGTVKFSIAVVLWGILMKLWVRLDALKGVLPSLVGETRGTVIPGDISTAHGKAVVGRGAPDPLPIHSMAKKLWSPMLAMGIMAVAIGFFISLSWASSGSVAAAAWTQGLQFLGEGFLLSGISFLLGTILWAIRTGGGEVQEGLGVGVETLRMPAAAKGFIALMMLGLLVSLAQFVGYLLVVGGSIDAASGFAFLGPLREFGLALILSGIALSLAAIGRALSFQFSRVDDLIRTGSAS